MKKKAWKGKNFIVDYNLLTGLLFKCEISKKFIYYIHEKIYDLGPVYVENQEFVYFRSPQ